MEETGIVAERLVAVGAVCGSWDGKFDQVHVFELKLPATPPMLFLDNREIIGAQWVSLEALPTIKLTKPVAAYLAIMDVPSRGGVHHPAAGPSRRGDGVIRPRETSGDRNAC